MKHKLYR